MDTTTREQQGDDVVQGLERQVASLESEAKRAQREADKLRRELATCRHECERLRREADPDFDPVAGDPTKQMGIGAIPLGSQIDLRPVQRIESMLGLSPDLDDFIADVLDAQEELPTTKLLTEATSDDATKIAPAVLAAISPEQREEGVTSRATLAVNWWGKSIMRMVAGHLLDDPAAFRDMGAQVAGYLRAQRQRVNYAEVDSAVVHMAMEWAKGADALDADTAREELERWAK